MISDAFWSKTSQPWGEWKTKQKIPAEQNNNAMPLALSISVREVINSGSENPPFDDFHFRFTVELQKYQRSANCQPDLAIQFFDGFTRDVGGNLGYRTSVRTFFGFLAIDFVRSSLL
jgi:hypothetical protein